MHDTYVVMKDGRIFCGPIRLFRPEEGYLTLILDPQHYDYPIPDKIWLRDVESAVTKNQRVTISRTEDEDELERAQHQGWDGT